MKKENEIEKAYKEIKEQKTPDLWARIESEVEKEDKKTDREIVPESNTKRKQISGISKSLKSRKIEAGLCLVAGIIAILVVVPIFFEHGKSYENAVIESTRDDEIESVESNTIGSDTMEGGTKENSKNTDNSTDKPKASLENKEIEKEEKNFLESDELSGHAQQISLEIEKEVPLDTLNSIDSSKISMPIVNQLKTLLENYDACELYKDQEGHLYVLEEGTLYVVQGTLLE